MGGQDMELLQLDWRSTRWFVFLLRKPWSTWALCERGWRWFHKREGVAGRKDFVPRKAHIPLNLTGSFLVVDLAVLG